MSIPVNTGNAVITYEGNGATVLFDIPFAFAAPAEIVVYHNGAPATGVTVYGAGDPFGGTVAFAAAPASGDVIRIRRLQTVHVSGNDTTARALAEKLVAGSGIALIELNDGDDETLQIAITDSLLPTGLVSPFAGSSAPTGWLFCDGAAVSRDSYANLFAMIGTTYGSGDGSTSFNLPDLRGRVAAGRDDMGGVTADRLTATSAAGLDGAVLGTAGGNQQHQLTIAEMPSHRHGMREDPSSNGSINPNYRNAGPAVGNTEATGGDQPHNNVQPTLILNYIIKA
ncbi:MAG: phage tail fiber protein [Ferrovibrio sp.]|uniref:phage tail fiber domain-containing protein n=1 Tax=Ferrovibrio sp. TaxID=1917215 RepID=UPI003918AEC5